MTWKCEILLIILRYNIFKIHIMPVWFVFKPTVGPVALNKLKLNQYLHLYPFLNCFVFWALFVPEYPKMSWVLVQLFGCQQALHSLPPGKSFLWHVLTPCQSCHSSSSWSFRTVWREGWGSLLCCGIKSTSDQSHSSWSCSLCTGSLPQ